LLMKPIKWIAIGAMFWLLFPIEVSAGLLRPVFINEDIGPVVIIGGFTVILNISKIIVGDLPVPNTGGTIISPFPNQKFSCTVSGGGACNGTGTSETLTWSGTGPGDTVPISSTPQPHVGIGFNGGAVVSGQVIENPGEFDVNVTVQNPMTLETMVEDFSPLNPMIGTDSSGITAFVTTVFQVTTAGGEQMLQYAEFGIDGSTGFQLLYQNLTGTNIGLTARFKESPTMIDLSLLNPSNLPLNDPSLQRVPGIADGTVVTLDRRSHRCQSLPASL